MSPYPGQGGSGGQPQRASGMGTSGMNPEPDDEEEDITTESHGQRRKMSMKLFIEAVTLSVAG